MVLFTNTKAENATRVTNRRINVKVGIRYDDSPGAADRFRVRKVLNGDPVIDTDPTLIVNFDTFVLSKLISL